VSSPMNIPNQSNPTVGFIGLGVLGKGLSIALSQIGYPVAGVYSRTPASAQWTADRVEGCCVFSQAQDLCDQVDLVFVTTPDGVISQLVSEIIWRPGQGVVHCCGAASEELLEPAASQGAATGAFHPCQTFAGLNDPAEAVDRLRGVTFAVAGNEWVPGYLRGLAVALGGNPITIPDGQRPLYHAASVMACGHLAALLNGAVRLWEGMGFTQEEAVRALYPLCRSTLENVAEHGLVASATGPAIRGDAATIKSHLEALSGGFNELIPAYTALSRESLPIARARGLGEQQLTEINDLLECFRQTGMD
jgi:predicted short-subunit dehydrogenase-like oxidoreductase (DUF2520 family)